VRVPITLVAELRRRPVDLLHVQYTAPPFVPCAVVPTIHDLTFEHLPETFKRRSWMQLRLTVRRTARRAAHIIASSEFTRDDIVKTYGISQEKVTVTPLAPPKSFAPAEREEIERVRSMYKIEGDYILAVGSIQPRKNLSRLLAAYSGLLHERTHAKLPQLVLVGKRAWLYQETIRSVGRLGLTGSVTFTGYVDEKDLPPLYSGALCFVYPSYFEGFGLPPLEAMRCGAPVITGNRTSLPEVVADAGLMVDPFDTAALTAAIGRMIDDASLRYALRERGFERARIFDWRETARLTLRAYERAFESAKEKRRISAPHSGTV
jgi:glycosyltransferase involved in cell wall biosynthesis